MEMTSGDYCLVRRCLGSGVLVLMALVAVVQNSAAQDGAKPTRLLICESSDQSCLKADPNYTAEWSFDGTAGVVISPAAGSGTQLTIETMSQDKIVIQRADSSGRSATYSGTIHGGHVIGTVEWTSSASGAPATSN